MEAIIEEELEVVLEEETIVEVMDEEVTVVQASVEAGEEVDSHAKTEKEDTPTIASERRKTDPR